MKKYFRFDDNEYLTGPQYFKRGIINVLLCSVLIGFFLESVNSYKRAKSLGHSHSACKIWAFWGFIIYPVNFINYFFSVLDSSLFLIFTIPFWYLWFINGPGELRENNKSEFFKKIDFSKVSLLVVIVIFALNITSKFISGLDDFFLLYPSNLEEPLNWYRFLTYSFGGGIDTLLEYSALIIMASLIMENKIKSKELIFLSVISVVIGGVIYAVISKDNIPITSSGMLFWGYAGAAFSIAFINYTILHKYQKYLLFILFLSTLGNVVFSLGNSYKLASFCVLITSMVVIYIKYQK